MLSLPAAFIHSLVCYVMGKGKCAYVWDAYCAPFIKGYNTIATKVHIVTLLIAYAASYKLHWHHGATDECFRLAGHI